MSASAERPPLGRDEFIEWVRREGEDRYHDHHRYHRLMHDGKLTREQLQQWVLNRYYYQTRVPIKDALILSSRRIRSFAACGSAASAITTATRQGEGGLELWLRLAEGVGLDREDVASCRSVLPGVRFACDGYVVAGARADAAGGGGLVADRVLLARPHDQAGAGLGEALPVDQQGHAGVLPHPAAARAQGLAGGDRLRHPARHDLRAAGAMRRRADPQDRDPLAPARQPLRGVRRARLGPRGARA